ncbi:hypothetical protein KVV02_001841 [Mortierella alpina]|uniref:Maltase n=1 Tax=Mortierella alpina TaxID=64518 RepID=A0A9P8A506_MORAP|nr:hypothetical protein KVV02_001841 [Mortierella alpina]
MTKRTAASGAPLVLLAATALAILATSAPSGIPSNSSQTAPLDGDDVCSNLLSRKDCGYVGIDKDGCDQRQCCWAESMAPIPWCFQKKNKEYACSTDMAARRDCGYLGITDQQCRDRNCCWDATENKLNAPYCFIQQHSCQGYQVTTAQETANGLNLDLELLGGCARFGKDIARLTVNVDFETESRIRVKITDKDNQRYEVPKEALPSTESTIRRVEKRGYEFKYAKSPFTFSIKRISDGEVLFDSAVAGMDSLVFEDEYLEISSVVPADANIYGLGEVVSAFRRDPGNTRQTMWARDAPTPVDQNLYGSHPFHLEMRKGAAHGVFLRNSNGMDVILTPKKVTYKAIGGILDFTVFVGPKPEEVINQYTEVIGRPHMPPAWALGWHQSRYGYKNIDAVEATVQRYKKEGLPLDGMWIDIDYMDRFYDFTYDETRFPQARMKALADNLASFNQSMILIIDPGIPIAPGYEPYDSGMRDDVFIKTLEGKPIEGRVWPGQTYFPDFLNTKETWAYWERQLKKTRDDIGHNVYPWIDMNEPSNFCNGPCTKDGASASGLEEASEKQLFAKRDAAAPTSFKYSINNAGRQAPLDEKTLATNAVHKNGMRLTDTHNLYGHMESAATHDALLNLDPNTRPFILTRSSFPGTGAYAAHWTGDNWSQWEHLKYSISGVLSFGLFGIPFTGSDICGFNGNAQEELCLRWHQLGALYPFARNHNDIKGTDQEPYVWPNTVLPAAKRALEIRYSLLPYFYSLFEQAHKTGKPVWQPLFFQYPQDAQALKIDSQFLLGDGVLVSPSLAAGEVQVKAYFPGNGRWFDLWTQQVVMEAGASDRYAFLKASAQSDSIPMSLAGGHMVPIQKPGLTVAETRASPVSLIVALDESGVAKGEMFVDDGKSVKTDHQAHITFAITAGQKLVSNVTSAAQAQQLKAGLGGNHGDRVEKIVVMGLNFGKAASAEEPKNVKVAKRAAPQHRGAYHRGDRHKEIVHLSKGHVTVSTKAAATAAAAKVSKFSSLNINGVEVAFGEGLTSSLDRNKGQDPASGLAWEVNQEMGSLTLTGLQMNLFESWFIQWRME